ncbi:hypothetical protein C1645_742841 [Glomus cerebriforme]|uniref:Uncharacterized protein n=1 Tax=Glomus cerebriforme TaxID=658196 RepID=A0A397SBT6_9GLOM|nr:hypothetical protein C1645_742841 [Glomus cerebriforme]
MILEESFQEYKSAQTFSPDQVKKILVEIGFNEDNVASWSEPVEVPLGVSSTLFIARMAIILSLSTEEILGGKVRKTIPEKIFAYTYNYRKNKRKLNVISQIRNKFGDTKRFLYRGINSHNINEILAEGFMDVRGRASLRKDFGVGLYTTPNIDYAISYAGRNGTLIIFDWSNPDRNLIIKHLNNLEEWKSTVKGWVCIDDDNKPRPPQHEADILEGFISSNYDHIHACHDPIPSEDVQVVGKTDSAINAFAERLFAVVYLE